MVKFSSHGPKLPFCSVVLPVRNEFSTIDRVLSDVLNQDYPGDRMEVIVVDGMSEDGTREIIHGFASRDARVKLLENPRRIIPAALNIGIRASRGDVLMRVDGHASIPAVYLRECVQVLESFSIHGSPTNQGNPAPEGPLAVGGAWDCMGQGPVGHAIAIALSSRLGVGNAAYRTVRRAAEPLLTDTVPFWVTARATFERLGLFHEEMLCHEDYEFNFRLRTAGGRILLLPWLRAKYYVRPSIRAVARQYGRYGFWKGRFLRSHPRSIKARHLIPPLFVLAFLCLCLWAIINRSGVTPFAILVTLYCTLLFAAGLFVAARRFFCDGDHGPAQSLGSRARASFVSFLLTPTVVSAVHFSWGMGVWLGLARGPVPGHAPKL